MERRYLELVRVNRRAQQAIDDIYSSDTLSIFCLSDLSLDPRFPAGFGLFAVLIGYAIAAVDLPPDGHVPSLSKSTLPGVTPVSFLIRRACRSAAAIA